MNPVDEDSAAVNSLAVANNSAVAVSAANFLLQQYRQPLLLQQHHHQQMQLQQQQQQSHQQYQQPFGTTQQNQFAFGGTNSEGSLLSAKRVAQPSTNEEDKENESSLVKRARMHATGENDALLQNVGNDEDDGDGEDDGDEVADGTVEGDEDEDSEENSSISSNTSPKLDQTTTNSTNNSDLNMFAANLQIQQSTPQMQPSTSSGFNNNLHANLQMTPAYFQPYENFCQNQPQHLVHNQFDGSAAYPAFSTAQLQPQQQQLFAQQQQQQQQMRMTHPPYSNFPPCNNIYTINNQLVITTPELASGLLIPGSGAGGSGLKQLTSTPLASHQHHPHGAGHGPPIAFGGQDMLPFSPNISALQPRSDFVTPQQHLTPQLHHSRTTIDDSGLGCVGSSGGGGSAEEGMPGTSTTNSSDASKNSSDESNLSDPASADRLHIAAVLQRAHLSAQTGSQASAMLGDPNLLFCHVPGRLALLSNSKKYPVFYGEISRRINPPECLNASFLGGILRKAKNKNGGHELRRTLAEHGMSLPPGRRKSSMCTVFTSLCEGLLNLYRSTLNYSEAAQLGNDFTTMLKESFPTEGLGQMLAAASPADARFQLNAIACAGQIVHDAIAIVQKAESTAYDVTQPQLFQCATSREQNTQELVQGGIVRFSRLTHGFGNMAVLSSWKLFSDLLSHMKNALEKNLQTGMAEEKANNVKNEFSQLHEQQQFSQQQQFQMAQQLQLHQQLQQQQQMFE